MSRSYRLTPLAERDVRDVVFYIADNFGFARAEQAQTRKQLREVRRSLNKEIEDLGTRVKAINIALIPALLVAFALGLSRWQRLRRKS